MPFGSAELDDNDGLGVGISLCCRLDCDHENYFG